MLLILRGFSYRNLKYNNKISDDQESSAINGKKTVIKCDQASIKIRLRSLPALLHKEEQLDFPQE